MGLDAPGYRQAATRTTPEDWREVALAPLVSFRTGPFGSALHRSDYVDGGIPVINPMQIIDGRITPTPSMAVSETAARRLAEFRLSPGDVVIGRRGEMGRCAVVQAEQDGWLCGTGSMIVKPGPRLDGRFLQRVLSSRPVIAAIESASVGTTMVNLNQGTLGNLRISVPPTKAEQEAIAEVLGDADALIESLERLIAKKRQIKQGAMQDVKGAAKLDHCGAAKLDQLAVGERSPRAAVKAGWSGVWGRPWGGPRRSGSPLSQPAA